MAPSAMPAAPGFVPFLRSVSSEPLDNSVETFVALLKRRQIRGSKKCALATTQILLRTVEVTKPADPERLIAKVIEVGKKFIDAAPHEPVVGNIVRRVLAIISEVEEEKGGAHEGFSAAASDVESDLEHHASQTSPRQQQHGQRTLDTGDAIDRGSSSPPGQRSGGRPPLLSSHTATGALPGRPVTSMFSILSHPTMRSPGVASPAAGSGTATPLASSGIIQNLRPDILQGVYELIEELNASDDEIAAAALDQVHPQETIFTYSSSLTVQRFLLKAASKRKFTVIHAEAYPNNHARTHSLITGNPSADEDENADESLPSESFSKPLTAAGITVVVIPDSAIYAVMSRVSKVVLDAHAVLVNGSFVGAAGSKMVVKAARAHRVPVLVLAATYKLSMQYPYEPDKMIEYGDAAKVVPLQDGELGSGLEGLALRNPLYDFVEGSDVDLFVTNQVPPVVTSGYLYRIVKEQYRDEDAEL